MKDAGCRACFAEQDNLSISEAFVLGLMVSDLQHAKRLRWEATLCDRHGKFPHNVADTPRVTILVAEPKKAVSCTEREPSGA